MVIPRLGQAFPTMKPEDPIAMQVLSFPSLIAAVFLVLAPNLANAQSLGGSASSLDRQNRMARTHDFTFLDTPGQVSRFADLGYLVRVRPNSDFDLHGVSFPYARPEVQVFVSRLASQYRAACGEQLVVTSLTRPESRQPRNASDRSVHPTGMAVDLRLSRNTSCRHWLERVLLELERSRVVEATRERRPAHYHVAVFPQPYTNYVASLSKTTRYRVRSGDSLWAIAREHGTTVARLREDNGLASSRILAGQVLDLPIV
jgi:LysM repeat protein